MKPDHLCSASIVTSSLRLVLSMLAPETGISQPPKAEVQALDRQGLGHQVLWALPLTCCEPMANRLADLAIY